MKEFKRQLSALILIALILTANVKSEPWVSLLTGATVNESKSTAKNAFVPSMYSEMTAIIDGYFFNYSYTTLAVKPKIVIELSDDCAAPINTVFFMNTEDNVSA